MWLPALAASLVAATASATDTDDAIAAFVSIRNGDAHIFVTDGRGTDKALTSGKHLNLQPSWSPDGKRLAFVSNRDGRHAVYLMQADGSRVEKLTRSERMESAPSWSPDGKSIAMFSVGAEAGSVVELQIYNVRTRKSISVLGNGKNKGPSPPTWSADSKQLAFLALVGEREDQVWVVNRDGSNARDISSAFSKRGKSDPEFSPDGRSVIYVADLRGPFDLIRTDLATGVSTNLTAELGLLHEAPRLSASGRWIAFSSSRDDPQESRGDIFVMNADGSEPRNLTRHGAEDFDARWLPGEDALLFSSLRTGTAQLFMVDVATGTTSRVTTHASHDMDHRPRPLAGRTPFAMANKR
jgi:Tol biopolymer transport system component